MKFIDQCLTFRKECGEATSRVNRLLEEVALLRCRSRCTDLKQQPPSFWKVKKSKKCHSLLKKGAIKIARRVRSNGPIRENIMDSPMDTMAPNSFAFKNSWRKSDHPSEAIKALSETSDRGAISAKEGQPCDSPWMQQLAKKDPSQLESPLHVELKHCLNRMAKLELENRALKELLIIKCYAPNDAGIETLLKMSLDNSSKSSSTTFPSTFNERVCSGV